MPEKRKTRDFYHEELVVVGAVLDKYPAIKECFEGDTVLKYPLKPWRNRKASGEYVRQVPISEVVQVIL